MSVEGFGVLHLFFSRLFGSREETLLTLRPVRPAHSERGVCTRVVNMFRSRLVLLAALRLLFEVFAW